ncbi:TPA: hypothetical protein RCG87_001748 [Enterobacter roggenkampii]|nr:hypothetical protein [Enterobacter roggenkampii]
MSTITREFTKEQLQQVIETDHVQCGEASALARIALASLEAEPVAWRCGSIVTVNKPVADDWKRRGFDFHPLYAAPPAPASVPDIKWPEEKFCPAEYAGSQLWEETEIWNKAIDACKEACRAVMLQGADGNSPAHSGCRPAQNCISPAQCGNSPGIPDGWVMLPAEPTQAMMNAWLSEVANWRGHAAGYRAMIAAAPQQEAQ